MVLYGFSEEKAESLTIRQQYDKRDHIRSLFRVKATATEMAFKNPIAWGLFILHVILWCLYNLDKCDSDEAGGGDGGEGGGDDPAGGGEDVRRMLADLIRFPFRRAGECRSAHTAFLEAPVSIGDLGVITNFLTFFVVFYNANCFTRYNQLYDNANVITGRIHNISLLLRAYYVNPSTRWNVLRYILASHCVHYWQTKKRAWDWSAKGVPEKDEDGDYPENYPKEFPEFCKDTLVGQGLLIPEEGTQLEGYKGNRHKLLFSWSIIALKKIMQVPLPDGEFENPYLLSEMEQTALLDNVKEELVFIRGAIGGMDNIMLFPMPYFYFHMVYMTMFVHHVMLAYGFLFVDSKRGSPMTLLVYPIIIFLLAGLVEVAKGMADPFGDKSFDFNVGAIKENIYKECRTLFEEPEEPFFGKLGNPKFNPKRNPDGTLQEADPEDKDGLDEDEDDGPQWPNSVVRTLKDEIDQLKKTCATGLGSADLAKTVTHLAEVNELIIQRLDALHYITEEVETSNDVLFKQVGTVELGLIKKIREFTDPNADEHQPPSRRSSEEDASGAPRRRSIVQVHAEAETVRKRGRRLSVEQSAPSAAAVANHPFGSLFNWDPEGQLVISYVFDDSPAECGGLRKGDIVLSVDGVGYKLLDLKSLSDLCDKKLAVETLLFSVLRDGQVLNLWVQRVNEEEAPKGAEVAFKT